MAKQKTPASEQLSQAEAKRLNSRLQQTPIAVVGMASVFADAKNLSQYWDNIMEKIDSIIDVPPSRWAIEDYYSPDKSMPDKTYCKRGAFIPDLDFDPMEFGLPPNILEVTDIAQLLALVVARDVIEDAGIGDGSGYDRDKVGVVLGVGGGLKQIVPLTSRLQYPVLEKVLTSCGVEEKDRAVIIDKFKKAYIPWEENSFPGMLGNVIAGRIANRFDLGGTNCVVDAACAGSLAAMKLAVSDLLEYRSEVMISGGICCDNSPFMYMSFSKTPAFTTNETIRPFDEDSKGMMVGEGIGMVALKRLEDAERDGDRVYAVLKGIGTSSDGRFKSIYAPRPDGQAKALKRAWDDAGVDPKTCGLIEAHGTGTMAGDAAEFAGLSRFFGQHNDQHQSIALGSVKSQIGHTKSAAGSAGFIKVCLALHHKVLPPTINVDKPGSQLDIDNSPFYLNTETRPWLPRQDGAPRRGGVSSFGFGGTNFHFVLEEYQPRQQGAYRLNIVPQAVLLAGDNEHAVLSHLQAWRTRLAVDVDEQPYVFNRLVTECGLQTPAASQPRIGFVARDAGEALAMIDQAIARLGQQAGAEAWTLPSGIAYRRQGVDAKGKVVALFSGQGSQYVNMGVELACNFPPMLAAAAAMDAEFSASGLDRLSSITYPTPVFSAADREAQDRKLQLTQHAQPAIGTFSAGVYDIFRNAGFVADFAAGHSFGELTALWAAGVLSDKDFRMLARARGQAMAARDEAGFDAGTMIAVVGEPDAVARAIDGIDGVSIANYNSRNQVVVAGATAQVEKAFELLKADFKVVKLPVSAAFHTPLVGHAQKPFAAAIDKAAFAKPAIPVFANGTGKAHSDKPADIKKALKNHILESVRFNEEVANLYQAGGRVFVEFGPKNVLTRLVENILSDKDDVLAIAVNANPKKSSDLQLRQAAVQMAVYGVELANVDPYSLLARPTEAPKKSPMAMKLSAASYVSDKTRKAFDDALNDGYRIAGQGQSQVVEKIVEKVVEKIVEVPVASAPAASAAGNAGQTAELVATLERSVSDLCRQQQQLLDVHEQVMQGPQQYARTVEQVLSAQAGGALPDAVDKTLAMYHQFQSDTLRVHEQYLNRHAGQGMSPVAAPVTAAAQPVPVPVAQPAPVAAPVPPAAAQTAPVVAAAASKPAAAAATKPAAAVVAPAPAAKVAAAVAAPAGLDSARVQQVMMAVVAEKTGYPAEMLELSMDMEADLGIDSIKRVEILGAVQDQLPGLPELNPEDLAELRTLGQIVDYMQAKLPQGGVAPVVNAAAAAPAGLDSARVQQVMMAVVAEKTGYPAEMLELSMDMEADLGIDSIKRVEILGAVQDQLPGLPELNPEDLAELRTLGQIVDYMQAKLPQGGMAPVANIAAAAPAGLDSAKVQQVMMAVVAEKTGYPAEMLELSMDMEADLGIDSIKRVEILGAVQDQLPGLPELNPEDLAELRTLGQIVDYMQSRLPQGGVAPVVNAAAAAPAGLDSARVQQVMMAVVAEKTGYPAEMLELSMDMEADLGIDSIKRVEILGAVQDQLPGLPELNPEDLAELRTLGQIVDYMQSRLPQAGVAAGSTPAAVSAASPGIDAGRFADTLMQVVAEKTGYPVEMLELDMDMEADLGIDSIKRVEILGAAQDAMPGLPEVSPETLAEMRTLREIVSAFAGVAGTAATTGAAVAEHAPSATVAIRRLNAPALIDAPASGSCLLVDDGSQEAVALAGKLQAQGWTVAVMVPGWVHSGRKKNFAKTVRQLPVSSPDDDTVAQAVAACQPLDAVIYLHSAGKLDGIAYPQDSRQGLLLAFLLAKNCQLKQSSHARASFVAVTRQGGRFGFDSADADLVQGGVSGLVKTLAQEWPSVFCRTVDLHDKLAGAKAADILFDELFAADRQLAEIGYDGEGRLTLVPELTDSYALAAGDSVDDSSVFLVSGGARGVTAHCVIRLAQEKHSRFILLGRSPLEDAEPAWASGISDADALKKAAMQALIAAGDKPTPVKVQQFMNPLLAQREIRSTLAAIEAAGGKALYVSADVTDSKALKKAVSSAEKTLGKVSGIIHGAGVLADKLIEQKTVADFDAVYRTKIDGLAAMLAAVDQQQLRHLVLFSSAAGFYGNPAQSDYAIANEILNKTALRFKALHPQAQVLSFNWGPWDGGMVTDALKRMFAERGVYIIPIDAGAELMVRELVAADNRCPQILVGNDMSGGQAADEGVRGKKPEVSRLYKTLKAANNPFLADHRIGGNSVLPTVCAIAWMIDAAESVYSAWRCVEVTDYRLFKGIVLDGSEAGRYAIEVKPLPDQGNGLHLEVKVSSDGDQGRPQFHYGAQLRLLPAGQLPAAPHFAGQLETGEGEPAARLYRDGTLFHGPSLQGIQRIRRCDENGMELLCQVPAAALASQGDFAIARHNVFADDLVYQAMLVWVREQKGLGSLPSATGSWTFYRNIAAGERFTLQLAVTGSDSSKVLADIRLIGENGELLAEVHAAQVTASESLNKLFQPAA